MYASNIVLKTIINLKFTGNNTNYLILQTELPKITM